jgi:hypothetical protein
MVGEKRCYIHRAALRLGAGRRLRCNVAQRAEGSAMSKKICRMAPIAF